MLFTSYSFIAFLAIVVVLYYLLLREFQWQLLLAASYVFYFMAEPSCVWVLLLSTLSAYLFSVKIDNINRDKTKYLKDDLISKEEKTEYKNAVAKRKRRWLIGAIFLHLGILSVAKYTNFVIGNVNWLLPENGQLSFVNMAVPMGISFYTFQTLGYLIDIYRGKYEAQRNPFRLALFVSFFPQLVQGPISRYDVVAPTMFAEHKWEEQRFSSGFVRILWGYFKKVVLADRLIAGVTTLTQGAESYTGAYVFAAMLFYAFELYCDFTGGIDITLGIAEILGISLPENFRLPFFSKNFKEYWKRWHITMGSWFTDYVFYPLSTSKGMQKLFRWSKNHWGNAIAKRFIIYISSFLVWFATGIWHGAAWNFIVWGLLNFLVIMVSQELEPLYHRFHRKFGWKKTLPYGVFEIVRTILLMSVIRLFDVYRNVPMTVSRICSMFTEGNWKVLVDGSLLGIGLSLGDYVILGIGFVIVLGVSIWKLKIGEIRSFFYRKPPVVYYGTMALLIFSIIIFGAYGVGYDSTQFIYNQF